MTKVNVEKIADVNGKLLLHVKHKETVNCYVTVKETGSDTLDPVWVQCNSRDFIRPENTGGVWPYKVTIDKGTNQGSFKVYGFKETGGEQALTVFPHGDEVCPNCIPKVRCTVIVGEIDIEGPGRAIPISRVAPFPEGANMASGSQVAFVIEIDHSKISLGDATITVDVSDRAAVSSPSGDWPYFIQVNDPDKLAATFMVTVNSVTTETPVTVFAYGDVAYDPFHDPHYQMAFITAVPTSSAKSKRVSK